MNRTALVIAFVSLSALSVGAAACVSSTNAPPVPDDAGLSPFDATMGTFDASQPFDSSQPMDSAPAAKDATTDTSVANDAGADTGVDAALSCASWPPYVDWDASTWDGAALSTTSSTGAPLPGPAPTSCLTGNAPSKLFVLNSSPCAIELWWVDWVCEEDFFFTIPPGEIGHVNSYASDSWRLRAAGSEELLAVVDPLPAGDAGATAVTFLEYPPSDAGPIADAAAYPAAPEENPDGAACSPWDAAVEYDAGEWDGAPAPLENDAGFLPGPPATTCSLLGDNPYPQLFVDNTGCPVDVYWVDYQCNEVFWQTIEMGRNAFAGTFATNVWRLRAHGSGELLAEVPIVPESSDGGAAVFRYP